MAKLVAPFYYFGGKRTIAEKVWEILGNVEHYIEPFAGSLAVLLARPNGANLPTSFSETVNDKDCVIVNVWRSIKYNPEETARFTEDIVAQVDMAAKRKYILQNIENMKIKMSHDPEYHDPKIAGYFIWLSSSWIGSRMLKGGYQKDETKYNEIQIPNLSTVGHSINKSTRKEINDWLKELSDRIKRVRITNDDWSVVCDKNWIDKSWNSVGIYLDPPYSVENRASVYRLDDYNVAKDVREFCIKMTRIKPEVKIVLSGYYDEHKELLDYGWDAIRWKTNGGYGNMSEESDAKINRLQETLFISPSAVVHKMF